jgi:hypothetical protein
MRSAVNQANQAFTGAQNTAGNEGGNASAIGGNLTPFLTEEMLHPQGYGQQGLSAQTAAAEGGAGGAASAFTGQAAQRAGATHNAGGFQAALDENSRNATKAAAGSAEQIAANNENLKQQQTQEGAAGLGNLYKTDTSAMLEAMGQEAPDVNSEVNANNSGWLQNATGILNSLSGGATAASKFLK